MQRLRVLLFLLAFLFRPDQLVKAQQSTALQPGVPIERTLGSGQVHVYTINLEAGQYLQLVVDQRGIDVVVRVNSPEQSSLGQFDTPNGDQGPENVSIVAAVTGTYSIAVGPLNQEADAKGGRYEIKIVELRQATEQELERVKDQELIKAKGIALVKSAIEDIAEIRSLPVRVHAQLLAANLIWNSDEKAASKLLADAVTGIKQYMTSIDVTDDEWYQNLQSVSVLRYELIQAVSLHDPEMALSLLRSTRPPSDLDVGQRGAPLAEESQMEMALATQIANRDPKRAFQIAEDTLKNHFSSNLSQTLRQLQNADPALATTLAKDIMTKLLSETLTKNQEASELTLNLLHMSRATRNSSSSSSSSSSRDGAGRTPLLSEQDFRDLLQKSLSEALSATTSATTNVYSNERNTIMNMLGGLKALGPDLERTVPGSSASVEKRISELAGLMEPQQASWQKFQTALNSGSTDAALVVVNQAPVEIRDQLYQQIIERDAAAGNLVHAKQMIMENVSNPLQRRQALRNLDQQSIYRAVSKGKIEEALRALASFKPARERASMLAQIATQIGPGHKRAVALNLLEQARAMLGTSIRAEDQEQMHALLEIASSFSRYDSKRAFEIVEPLIDQFNEILEAGSKLSGFGQEYVRDGELIMNNGNNISNIAEQLARALAVLSTADFDRGKTTAERIQAPEVRLIANLNIAQAAIHPPRR